VRVRACNQLGAIDRVYPGHGAAGGPELLDEGAAFIRDFVDATDGAHHAASASGELVRRYPGRCRSSPSSAPRRASRRRPP
jgi:hypothetical protein